MNHPRKTFIISTVLIVTSLSIPASRADDDDHEQPATQPVPRVSREREMEAMGKAYRTIRQQVNDPTKNESTIAAVLDLEQHTLAAKSAIPHSATTMPTPAANVDKLADYRGMMLNVLRQELDLEEQLRGNHNDKAAATVDSLHDLESEGHGEFRPRRNRR